MDWLRVRFHYCTRRNGWLHQHLPERHEEPEYVLLACPREIAHRL